jgi:Spy/CpxP family protein refolding chaperone
MKRALTAALLTLAASFAAVAQEAPPQQKQSPALTQGEHGVRRGGLRRMRMRMRARREGLRALRQLNLTEQQVAQMRSLRQTARQSTQAQRDELRQLLRERRQSGGQLTEAQQARAKQLHEELRAARQRTRGSVLAALTPEQRTQLEQLKAERKARREEFRQRRQQ